MSPELRLLRDLCAGAEREPTRTSREVFKALHTAKLIERSYVPERQGFKWRPTVLGRERSQKGDL